LSCSRLSWYFFFSLTPPFKTIDINSIWYTTFLSAKPGLVEDTEAAAFLVLSLGLFFISRLADKKGLKVSLLHTVLFAAVIVATFTGAIDLFTPYGNIHVTSFWTSNLVSNYVAFALSFSLLLIFLLWRGYRRSHR
jgi:hypothetical protein